MVSDTNLLSTAVQGGYNWDTLANIVSQAALISAPSTPSSSPFQVLVEGDDALTPIIIGVLAGNPPGDKVYGKGDTVTIYFDSLMNQPPVSTKTDLDKILTFTPSLGGGYTGQWLDGSSLQITVVDPPPSPSSPPTSLTFNQNYDSFQKPISAYLGSAPARCVGTHLCDGAGVSVGICSQNKLSCRVNHAKRVWLWGLL